MKNSYKRREAYHRDQIHKSNNKGYGQTILAGVLILVIIAWTIYPLIAKAGTFEMHYGLSTNHTENYEYKYNEDNNLWAASYRFNDSSWGVLGSKFDNSFYVESYAAAATYSLFEAGPVEFELLTGLLKGYTEIQLGSTLCPFGVDSDICFFIAPKLSLEVFDYKGFSPKVSAMILGNAFIVTAGFSYKF